MTTISWLDARDRSMEMAREGWVPQRGEQYRYRDGKRDEVVTIAYTGLSHAGFNGMQAHATRPDGTTEMVCAGYLYEHTQEG